MKRLALSLLTAMFAFLVCAQPQGVKGQQGQSSFDPQKFQQMVEESLTKAADLTPDEAKAFFPLYNEMKDKQRDMGRQIFEVKKNASNGDNKNYAEAIQKIHQLKVKMAEMEADFYKNIVKVIPAEKAFKVMKAEDDFHRKMVQRQRRDRRGGNARPGQHPLHENNQR